MCVYIDIYTIFLLETLHFCSGLFQMSLRFSAEVSISLLRYPMPLEKAYLVYSRITLIITFKAIDTLNLPSCLPCIQFLYVIQLCVMIMLEETPLISFDLKFNSMDTMKHAFLIMLFSSKKKHR